MPGAHRETSAGARRWSTISSGGRGSMPNDGEVVPSVALRPLAEAAPGRRVLFLTRYDKKGASSRCRVYQYLPHLAARGITGEIVPWVPSAAELWQRAGAADAVLLQKRVPTLTKLLLLRRRAPVIVFDFDDAIWLRRRRDNTVCAARPGPGCDWWQPALLGPGDCGERVPGRLCPTIGTLASPCCRPRSIGDYFGRGRGPGAGSGGQVRNSLLTPDPDP